ncbi:GNAT family N-acetyltransferase [Streptomyces noursei]|uniref:GNAT family N-acetyltransferase n=1 Tax=Streptomyces noursei TaxID=1971 RepID=UPI00331AD408
MTTGSAIELRRTTDSDAVWSTLIDIYVEVRADRLHRSHYSVERFGERLARHAAEPGWEAVIGFDRSVPIGFVYATTLQTDASWWRRMTPPLPEFRTRIPTVALKEGMLRTPWRGKGLARRGHEVFLAGRPEQQATLLVNPLAGNGKVKALYESWGYETISEQQPALDGPVLTAMLRAVRVR